MTKQNFTFYHKGGHGLTLTATQKKLFKIAYDYAIENKKNDVKVNRTLFTFDFLANEVFIKGPCDSVFYCFGFNVL